MRAPSPSPHQSRPGVLRRMIDGPPLSALGLVWPWSAPWRLRSAAGTPEGVPAGAPTFSLVSANALGSNPRAADFAAALTAIDADVFVVVEASDHVLDALDAAEIHHHHGPGTIERRPRWSGCGIWSRHPTERLESGDAGHAYLAVRVHLPSGPVDVVAVHTWAPVYPRTGQLWRESFDVLAEVVGRLEGPVVAAGDYNATLGHRPMRAFLARTGLRDAHTAAGRGRARTWPASRVLPPLGLIDRLAISPEVGVVEVCERAMPGSDHLAVVSTLALTPAPPGGR